ncbi:MAG TPA: hypothetical protein VFS47_03320 [Steroidobacteraceae bacterium]|jgi:hypothetical protein|nr:hypothetical protein [Steroidobacteraceae bacterium]
MDELTFLNAAQLKADFRLTAQQHRGDERRTASALDSFAANSLAQQKPLDRVRALAPSLWSRIVHLR